MRVIVTGSSGFIGSALVGALEARGDEVTRLKLRAGTDLDTAALEGHDAVVHLAGAGIGDKRWNESRKRDIIESRSQGTAMLAEALASLDDPPKVLASGSAIGVYGSDRGDAELTERSEPGDGFLAEVVQAWEVATAPALSAGIRVAHLRTGIVLGRGGGVLKRMAMPFKLGVGGRIGSGKQWVSWISLADHLGAVQHVLDNDLRGPVNLTAPNPVRNVDLARALGRVLRRPAAFPVPAAALRLAFGKEMANETILASQRVVGTVLADTGFVFAHADVESALRAALRDPAA